MLLDALAYALIFSAGYLVGAMLAIVVMSITK